SAISFGVIVLTLKRRQDCGAGISWSHGAVRAGVLQLLGLAPAHARFCPEHSSAHAVTVTRAILERVASGVLVQEAAHCCVSLGDAVIQLVAVVFPQRLCINADIASDVFLGDAKRVQRTYLGSGFVGWFVR